MRSKVFGGVVVGGVAVVGALIVLLVVSPAAFISLVPGPVAGGGSSTTPDWAIVVLSLVAAGALATLRGRARLLRGTVITLLTIVAIGYASHALEKGHVLEDPVPENTCVAYSGGRHTCPGG